MATKRSIESFLKWVRTSNPQGYKVLTAQARQSMANLALGEETPAKQEPGIWETLANKVTDIAGKVLPAYYQYESQKQLLDVNLERMKKGLEPISGEQVAPTVKVQTGFDPAELAKNPLVWAIGIGLVWFLSRRGKA